MEKRIITAAITGAIHTPRMSPHLPVTVDQIADEAVRAYEAGAAVAHIHVRDQETGQPSPDINLFKKDTLAIRPEKISLHIDKKDTFDIRGKIIDVTYIGEVTKYLVKISDSENIKVKTLNRCGTRIFNINEKVYLSFAPTDAKILSVA